MRYNPALTGLRGVAILPVIGFHCQVPGFSGGFLGVDIFFVLSGFLITSILQEEYVSNGQINLTRFYRNRLLRLTPPLFVCIAALLAIGLAEPLKALIAATYFTDVLGPFDSEFGSLRHTWSLAVEEHYYLVWPIALTWILRTRRPFFWIMTLFAAATFWRAATLPFLPGELSYFRLDARLTGLLLGSAIALEKERLAVTALTARVSFCLVLAGMFSLRTYTTESLLALTAIELASAGLLLSALSPNTVTHKMLSHPALVRIGLWSYGLYLWHFPIAYTMRQDHSWPVVLAVTASLSCILAASMHHFLEVPLTRYRRSELVAVPASTG